MGRKPSPPPAAVDDKTLSCPKWHITQILELTNVVYLLQKNFGGSQTSYIESN